MQWWVKKDATCQSVTQKKKKIIKIRAERKNKGWKICNTLAGNGTKSYVTSALMSRRNRWKRAPISQIKTSTSSYKLMNPEPGVASQLKNKKSHNSKKYVTLEIDKQRRKDGMRWDGMGRSVQIFSRQQLKVADCLEIKITRRLDDCCLHHRHHCQFATCSMWQVDDCWQKFWGNISFTIRLGARK